MIQVRLSRKQARIKNRSLPVHERASNGHSIVWSFTKFEFPRTRQVSIPASSVTQFSTLHFIGASLLLSAISLFCAVVARTNFRHSGAHGIMTLSAGRPRHKIFNFSSNQKFGRYRSFNYQSTRLRPGIFLCRL